MMTTSFDAILRRVFEATGLESQNDLARALGLNRSAITQARKKGTVPEKWLLKLYRHFGLNPDWVAAGSGPVFVGASQREGAVFHHVPKVSARLSAGGGSFEVGTGIRGYCAFEQDWLRRKGEAKKMVLMDIFGNSMEPELKAGDTVLVDQSQTDILSGAIYAVGVDDTIMVKRLEKHPNRIVLLSDNRDYAPIYLDKAQAPGMRIIGKVIWICRELR
jgi:phage repressor protein C with HTH and peptisase S24 domain